MALVCEPLQVGVEAEPAALVAEELAWVWVLAALAGQAPVKPLGSRVASRAWELQLASWVAPKTELAVGEERAPDALRLLGFESALWIERGSEPV